MRGSLLAVCLLTVLAWPATLSAQLDVGPQASWADDADFGIGGRAMLGIPVDIPLAAIGSFDYFFPDGDVDYWEINANAVYKFRVPGGVVAPYAGAGLNVAHTSVGDLSETDVGLNLLGGATFDAGQLTPFAELRVELGGGEQFVLTGGLLFTVGPGL
ncbi:MAG: porin family protein [Gemmatimonadetes bacterium]|uniref:Porin family protein n=1 Tax=Candidatus Kutchimonas denitrificans TaxID=3056748 RepID=A0AAE4ZAN6_9BACT|nr:porin family protein [Gemmatimonadota bacterium]NIR76444.1 porin family protein [Candidatus Kutchimonas denitrificans]NIS03262.1 porin family protein [Gemmatimonadota bacterium]NIT69123.1 porin family protein [Gemmatimonadota bacterium]NIU54515.1 hypothetical protein [Gemmatimonadota bacterium]